jgi:hypothetical protein
MQVKQLLSGLSIGLLFVLLAMPNQVSAVQPLTLKEFNYLCKDYDAHPKQSESQQCARYIKGFIDGAIATDIGVRTAQKLNSDDAQTFSERATSNRTSSRVRSYGVSESSDFCLGDPVVISHVIATVTENIKNIKDQNRSALGAMFQILKDNYPCKK